MKKVLFAVMCAVILFGIIAIGYAEREDWRGGIRSRIHEAKQRIEQGIENGSLTRPEAKKLKEELDSILDKIDRMKEDGHLSQMEREKINHDLDRLDKDIAREKRDDNRRGDWGGGIRSRIHDAKQSIEQGIENGSLTRPEAKRLKGELDDILAKIDRMKDDGHLSEREREKINHDLDRLERDITREKRDDDKRRGDDDHRRY